MCRQPQSYFERVNRRPRVPDTGAKRRREHSGRRWTRVRRSLACLLPAAPRRAVKERRAE